MIAFVSIFLGLVAGVKPVELAVSGSVTEIEIRLDGELVGLLREEPWQLDCDFGTDLTTHELVAIARDARGVEIDRAVQRINIPRPNVDTQLLLDGWRAGQPGSARLLSHSVEAVAPSSISIVLDGEVLADRFADRYDLPKVDPDSIHFLSARLEFPGNISSSAEIVFGGIYGDATETELTAIPLIANRKLRRIEDLQGRLASDGVPLRVVAIEDGPAEVVIVRDHRSLSNLELLGHAATSLAKKDALLIMSPRAYLTTHPDTQYAVFPLSPPMIRKDMSLPMALASIRFDRSPVLPQRLTDAVATAGLRAAASQKRRAVVLVTTDCNDVLGQWSTEQVQHFLAQIRVPFKVWLVNKPDKDAPMMGFCAGAEPIHGLRRYHAAINRLRRDLQTQQIAWVEGRHLQRKISLIHDEPGLSLAN